jgi:hypothetical protein
MQDSIWLSYATCQKEFIYIGLKGGFIYYITVVGVYLLRIYKLLTGAMSKINKSRKLQVFSLTLYVISKYRILELSHDQSFFV